MLTILSFLASGCVFGLAAGFTPGPTTTLVITQTLRFRLADGIKVAIAPALTDGPIIAVALIFMGQVAQIQPALGAITLLGAAFLIFLAIESLRVRGIALGDEKIESRSLRRGVIVNLLNPHPYLFWFVVGAPSLHKAIDESISAAVVFLLGFYACLIGGKIFIACLVARSRSFLTSRAYIWVNRGLGVALAVFAVLFLRDAVLLLGLGAPPH